ncbi:MAG: [protein-PII] uridylyltransferase [Acidimicrobiales bacterium]
MADPTPVPSIDRAGWLAQSPLTGVALSRAWVAEIDAWLTALWERARQESDLDDGGLALVAVGSYGRRELSVQSDLDLVLLHDPSVDVEPAAQELFYPVWDAGLKLGHAVRTVDQAVALAADDLETATGLLDIHHVGGDPELTEALALRAEVGWKANAKKNLPALRNALLELHATNGEVAFLLEPDLKDSKGGLRDLHGLRWLARARNLIVEGDREVMEAAGEQLLAARVELHRRTGRPGDVLALQEQDAVAEALGGEADELMAAVAHAGREISWISEDTWRRALSRRARGLRVRKARSLGHGIVIAEGTIRVEEDAALDDPSLPLRVAYESASRDLPMQRTTLDRLGAASPPMPDPWPEGVRDLMVSLLAHQDHAIMAVEALEHHHLWSRLVPEWEPCRSKPQRNAYHRFTVDRHLLEAATRAAGLIDMVDRPDLLVVGALLHDIGKGYPGDHTEVGMELVAGVAPRMGFEPDDVATLIDMVRLHLLLPDVATRRDLGDDATLMGVAEEVGDDATLRLLHALTVADSEATGPAAWGLWKAQLVEELVERTAAVLGGYAPDEVATTGRFPTEEDRLLMEGDEFRLVAEGDTITIANPDRPGAFARVAGVISLNGLNVMSVKAYSDESPLALSKWKVVSRLDTSMDWDAIEADLRLALSGRLAIAARLADRMRTYGSPAVQSAGGERREVHFDNEGSARATIVQVLAPDQIGLLYRITHALADMDIDLRSAKVQTLGHEVIDSFYVVDQAGAKLTDELYLGEIERAVLSAIGGG